MDDAILVHTTTATAESARTIARALVAERLAGCVQIHAVESVYRWEGAAQTDAEFALQCKTVRSRYDAVAACIRRHHTYELPEIVVTAIAGGSKEYLAWIEESVSPTAASSS